MFSFGEGDILAEPLVKSVKTRRSGGAFLEVFPTPNTYVPVTLSCTCTSAPDARPPPGHSRALCWCWAELGVLQVALSRHHLPLHSSSACLHHCGDEWIFIAAKEDQYGPCPCVRCPCAPTASAVWPPLFLLPGMMAWVARLVHRQVGGCIGDFCNVSF